MASEIWAGFMRRLICMFAGVLLFILAFVSFSNAANTNTFYASQFPGATVADKVTAAQNECVRVFAGLQNCRVVIDGSLQPFPNGTMPSLCPKCTVEDWRNGTPFMSGAVVELVYYGGNGNFTMAAAQTEIGSQYYHRRFDATQYSQFRITTACTASSVAIWKVQYSPDNVTYSDAEDNSGTAANMALPAGATAGGWGVLKPAARGDVYWRIVVSGGDGTARSCMVTAIQFKP
jgi:hypothetical protein